HARHRDQPHHLVHGADLPDRRDLPPGARGRDPDDHRRRARAGPDRPGSRRAGGRLLSRELSQVALCPERGGLPLRPPRAPGTPRPADHQLGLGGGKAGGVALPRSLRVGRHRRPLGLPQRPRRDHLPAPARLAARPRRLPRARRRGAQSASRADRAAADRARFDRLVGPDGRDPAAGRRSATDQGAPLGRPSDRDPGDAPRRPDLHADLDPGVQSSRGCGQARGVAVHAAV
ncbi:MAG: Cysteine desulfurase, partial [uncultured Thermomicrobiales bacterium]